MIIPTPQHDPLFANDGVPFQAKMIGYIEREFADLLGAHKGLLSSEAGLEALAQMTNARLDRQKRAHAA